MPKKKSNKVVKTPQINSAEEVIEVVEKLDDSEKQEFIGRMVKAEMFSGPLPPPHLLAEYNSIEPDFANRIILMAEQEQEAQISERKQLLNYAGRDSLLGALFTFVIISLVIIIGGFLIWSDKPLGGYTSLAVGLGGIIKLFLSTNKTENNNDEDKTE